MTKQQTVHLVCNAHLDPVWLWKWDEGAAEAISTFRTAAELCEQIDAFVFNHNEVILYEWIEEYDPALFERIRRLVKSGNWHIMGGWFLQPDCTMPHGESYVRQIETGRRYFAEKFGARPTTAINFDPFGHSRGLVQIMARAGFTSYLFCRPGGDRLDLPNHDFRWVGFDGSQIIARRSPHHYNSPLGRAREKVETTLIEDDLRRGLILWGIGDHGGGPSKADVAALDRLIAERTDLEIRHSTPDAYFAERYPDAEGADLPEVSRSLVPWAVGCYTSQVRIKQEHSSLESDLLRTEKMLVQAHLSAGLDVPLQDLDSAQRDLMIAQFHDILPGSSIEPVEEWALRLMGHGREILERLRTRAFFALCRDEAPAEEGTVSVFVYNPHPVPLSGVWECEYNLPDQNREGDQTIADVYSADDVSATLPSQLEREESNINLDWRKRIVFAADLAPSSISRFVCRLRRVPEPEPAEDTAGDVVVERPLSRVRIARETGLLEEYTVRGETVLGAHAGRIIAIDDTADPWGMTEDRFDGKATPFALLSEEAAARFAGLSEGLLEPVRVVEDGPVRTVVEALFGFRTSRAAVQYIIPKSSTAVEFDVRLYWNERDTMVKLVLPVSGGNHGFVGQCPYGVDELFADGRETSSGRWCAVEANGRSLLVTKPGIYGSDLRDGSLRLSLLRSPGYAAHPIPGKPFMAHRRFTPRIDQGVRRFRFSIDQVPTAERDGAAVVNAARFAEPPVVLSFNPTGSGGRERVPSIVITNPAIELSACRMSRDGRRLRLRLFCASSRAQRGTVEVAKLGAKRELALSPFEILTVAVDLESGAVSDEALIEEQQ